MSSEILLTIHGGDAGDVYDLAERVRQIAEELGQGYNSGDDWSTEVVATDEEVPTS